MDSGLLEITPGSIWVEAVDGYKVFVIEATEYTVSFIRKVGRRYVQTAKGRKTFFDCFVKTDAGIDLEQELSDGI